MTYGKIKKKLLSRRAGLLQEIGERDDVIAEVRIDEEEDRQVERLDDELLSALSASDREEILRIDAALAKIAEGSYGTCEECGEAIAPARLEAVPDAVLCITCATRAEATL